LRDGCILVATDRRLIVISPKFLGAETLADEALAPQPGSVSYRDIRGVQEHLCWLHHKLQLDVGGTPIELRDMRRKGARAVADVIRRHAAVVQAGP
jgi:hypothetical protein